MDKIIWDFLWHQVLSNTTLLILGVIVAVSAFVLNHLGGAFLKKMGEGLHDLIFPPKKPKPDKSHTHAVGPFAGQSGLGESTTKADQNLPATPSPGGTGVTIPVSPINMSGLKAGPAIDVVRNYTSDVFDGVQLQGIRWKWSWAPLPTSIPAGFAFAPYIRDLHPRCPNCGSELTINSKPARDTIRGKRTDSTSFSCASRGCEFYCLVPKLRTSIEIRIRRLIVRKLRDQEA